MQQSFQLIDRFLKSRTQGLSPRTFQFYQGYLNRAEEVVGIEIKAHQIKQYLDNLQCSNGGRHAYYRTLRAFYNWLYSAKSGLGLNPPDNPICIVDAPKVEKRVLPSLTPEQLNYLISQTESTRDSAIISLFADSGLRLSELANINPHNIDWQRNLIKAICKGNKEGYAPFGSRTRTLLKKWLEEYNPNDRLWNLNQHGITSMLKRLARRTGLPCNAHTFRRSFACTLARRGVDSLHIMRLGRWESLSMVERYTQSVKFEDSLKLYSAIMGNGS